MNKKLNQEEQDKKKLLWFLWLHDYFHRYYNDQASEKETKIIKSWNPEKLPGVSFEASESQVKNGIEKVWGNLSAQYRFANTEHKPVKIFRLQQLLPYAAAIMIMLTASVAVYQYHTYDTLQSLASLFSDEMKYQTGNGDVKQFMLPDGSSITLNGNTSLAFVKDEFDGNKREIWLKDGEVFFDVAKNPSKPFIIHTKDADVVVRGTSFSVTAYSKLHKSSVAVKTGKVEVIKDNKISTLFPSQTAVIDKKLGAISLSEIKTSNIATWKEGNLTLSHSDADELIFRMEQHFNVEIKVQPNLLTDINFSASFEKETSLKNALDIIADIYGIRYAIKNNSVTLYK
ncbi:FecR family protein [uncultured Flavobacterium sp.]|uniref:FecR family protein n=1 Tax=uncultured Flavobacterium sp. TaxID=165435 RepID=UPI0025ED18EA|nr:FecR family protein [uncultured Flavobacterium sp.]